MDSPHTDEQLPRLVARAALCILGGSAVAVLGALLVASHVALRSDAGLLVTWGLLIPMGCGLAVLLGPWLALLNPGSRLPSFSLLLDSKQRRLRVLLSGPAIVLAWYLVGQMSLRLLGAFEARPGVGGLLVASSALGVLTMGAWGVDRVAALLAPRLSAPSVRMTLLLGAVIPTLLATGLVALGSTSGVGSPVALFGVFRRPELDLVPVVHLIVIVVCILEGAMFALKQGLPTALLAAALGLGLGGFGVVSAWNVDFRGGVAVERSRGLAATSLSMARRLSDADGDGFAPQFGGGDCDDSRPDVHPGALDKPENGIDEDCQGGDRAAAASSEEPPDAAPEPAARLPEDANVLLLTIDTLRADLGYTRKEGGDRLSPELDALAARSTVYEHAYSLASYTSKSLGPLMVGRYPSETKRTFEHFDRFSKDVPFLQERLQQAGIHTTSVQGYWYFFFKGYGFERGWDVLDSTSAPKLVAIEGDKTSNGDKLADRTIEHLKNLKQSKKRFFVWTHWVDPHSEYVPHAGYDFGDEPRQRYDGEVAFVDAQVGRILKALGELELENKTVVIVTSDHGEAFGEHGMIRHGFEVWDTLVHVPLILHIPGTGARRVKERRSFIDVAPTILETMGVPLPEGADDFVRGTSLLRDALAKEGEPLAERPVLVDMPKGPHNEERRAFYDGDLKLITSNGRVLGLYDLAGDPGEENDLSGDPDRVAQMQAKMNAFLDRLRPVEASR